MEGEAGHASTAVGDVKDTGRLAAKFGRRDLYLGLRDTCSACETERRSAPALGQLSHDFRGRDPRQVALQLLEARAL